MIIIKTAKEIRQMKEGGKILSKILLSIVKDVKPGATTEKLEKKANELIKKAGGRPSFKGFKTMLETKAFPTALCISINNEIVHAPALPSRVLNEGDIVGIDVGMEYPYGNDLSGYYTDMAVTIGVGKISKQAEKLIRVTKKSLKLAIKQVKLGNTLSDIGKAVQTCVEKEGFSVVRDLVGHGVGTAVHEEPQVPNFEIVDKSVKNVKLKPGMTLAIEPMVNTGTHKVKCLSDGFTIVTADGGLSAHFEHTVALTKKGCEVITE
jgi:methionyl aminopeptidase